MEPVEITTDDVIAVAMAIIEDFERKFGLSIDGELYYEMEDSIRERFGRRLGLRTEDGEYRTWELELVEGEPYVYDV